VQINGQISNVKSVKFGVPQCTILGPILFSIYINDLFELNLDGKALAYADNTALFLKAKNSFDLELAAKSNLIK